MAASQDSPGGSSTRPAGAAAPGRRRSSRWSSLVPVGIVLLGLIELAILVAIGVNTSLWWAVLVVVIGWVIAVALLVAAGQQSFSRLRSLLRAVRGVGEVQEHLSRPAFTMLAALFFFFPGVVTDVVGLLLLLTPVQRRSVRAMGLGSGSAGARSVLYRRSGTGVIDGEIILENRPTEREQRRREDPPPTIAQD